MFAIFNFKCNLMLLLQLSIYQLLFPGYFKTKKKLLFLDGFYVSAAAVYLYLMSI